NRSCRPPSVLLGPAGGVLGDPGFAAALGEIADAGDVAGAFLHADHAAGLEQVEQVAGLDRLVVGGERDFRLDAAAAFGFGVLEAFEQLLGVGDLEVVLRQFLLVGEEHVAVSHGLYLAYRFAT